MKSLRLSLALLVFFIGIFLNIERLDVGGEINFINLDSVVYIIAGVAALSTIIFSGMWKLSTRKLSIFWIIVYLLSKFFVGDRPLIGGFYTYLTIVELNLLLLLIVLTRRVMVKLGELEEVVSNIVLEGVSNRVKKFQDARIDIDKEIARSRRYSRPLALVVLKLLQENVEEYKNIQFSQDIMQTILLRYKINNLMRELDKNVRRPDLILNDYKENRILLLLPETDTISVQKVVENIQAIANTSIKSIVSIGTSTFPKDALTFDDLVFQAESSMNNSDKSYEADQVRNLEDAAIDHH